MILSTGVITTTAAFFVFEFVMQRRVIPVFFPEGGLHKLSGTIRIRIRTRLIALLFACNLIPLISILLDLYHRPPDREKSKINHRTPISLEYRGASDEDIAHRRGCKNVDNKKNHPNSHNITDALWVMKNDVCFHISDLGHVLISRISQTNSTITTW